jgi:uncharacterized protein YqiB (DUF1249 family)
MAIKPEAKTVPESGSSMSAGTLKVESESNENLHKNIYFRLLDVVPDIHTIKSHGKSVVGGSIMDLCFDVLSRSENEVVIALSHYYKHDNSGNLIADPDVEVAVYLNRQLAEALSYQDTYVYRTVYSTDRLQVDLSAKQDLNQFLNVWLGNLIEQGHSIKTETGSEKV